MSDHARWPALAAIAVLIGLLGWNLAWSVRNQQVFERGERPALRTSDLRILSLGNPHGMVRMFGLYYRLRKLRGATLVFDTRSIGDRFYAERVSRMSVELVPAWFEIKPDAELRLPPVTYKEVFDHANRVWIIIVPGTRRYVLTRQLGDDAKWYILPEELYLREARPGAGPPEELPGEDPPAQELSGAEPPEELPGEGPPDEGPP